ncbi:TagF domain-containing protein [Desulfospira joergensenii]|uniref:TagF domain-containing protein n=1 Tax=Desulfospira joergensenii TaxID=53329 RepID=UPI0003B34360|nr:TagF domain-containing protein [Desulfospira joergensenii]
MLGIKKQTGGFQVSASGKHPAFNDYFSVNVESPLAIALASWVENGMAAKGKTDRTRIPRSFRFWVRGIRKGELSLGILRESSDRMGRIYPLMIMGSLVMNGRDREWQSIFDGFEMVFRNFENMTTTVYDRFNDFEDGLLEMTGRGSPPFEENGKETDLSRAMGAWFHRDRDQEMMTLPVDQLKKIFSGLPPKKESRGFFRPGPDPPGAAFLGGLPGEPVITIYSRALRTRDFLTLFNLTGRDETENRQHP